MDTFCPWKQIFGNIKYLDGNISFVFPFSLELIIILAFMVLGKLCTISPWKATLDDIVHMSEVASSFFFA